MESGEPQYCMARQRESLSALYHQTFLTCLLLQTLGLSYADPARTHSKKWPEGRGDVFQPPCLDLLHHPLVFPHPFSFFTLLSNFFSITQTSLLLGTAFEPPLKLTTREEFQACASTTARLQVQTNKKQNLLFCNCFLSLQQNNACRKTTFIPTPTIFHNKRIMDNFKLCRLSLKLDKGSTGRICQ